MHSTKFISNERAKKLRRALALCFLILLHVFACLV